MRPFTSNFNNFLFIFGESCLFALQLSCEFLNHKNDPELVYNNGWILIAIVVIFILVSSTVATVAAVLNVLEKNKRDFQRKKEI